MIVLSLVNTVALAGVVLFMGYTLRRLIPPLARFNIPAPVIGGLPVAILETLFRMRGETLLKPDETLHVPFMIAFFTSVGFGASLSLLRVGGRAVFVFLALSTLAAVAQNVLGAGVAAAMGQHPLMGVLAGSVALTGGPATALAWGVEFEKVGVPGAVTLGAAAAMAGIVAGGLLGGPIGTHLIEKLGLRPAARPAAHPSVAANVAEEQLGDPRPRAPQGEDVESYALLKALVIILVAMWAGGGVSGFIEARGIKMPAYIGAMLVAAMIRNLDDLTGWLRLSQKVIDDLGTVALSLFLSLAIMILKLWELASLAVPLLAIVAVQLALVWIISLWVVPRVMGRDYDAAVMSSGFCGFMLGTTANAMANMGALVERYGPAPRAYLVVPMVGAFFIDITNNFLITVCLNLLR